jgi:hypothetical protein
MKRYLEEQLIKIKKEVMTIYSTSLKFEFTRISYIIKATIVVVATMFDKVAKAVDRDRMMQWASREKGKWVLSLSELWWQMSH